MTSPTYIEFVCENERLLERLYNRVSYLNEDLTFDNFCQFVYYHSY